VVAQNFKRIDSLALNAPYQFTKTPDDLAAYCQANALNEEERVRFFYVWVARHIQYDSLEAKLITRVTENDEGFIKQLPPSVFQSRKAVCSGYTNLFGLLCEKVGMPHRYVSGRVKENDTIIEPLHAWSIVRVSGQWQLFDVTWASNALERDSQFLNPRFNAYFNEHPDSSLKKHLAFDPVFQLKTQPVNWLSPKKPLEVVDFQSILTAEMAKDSATKNWLSAKRAYAFAPEDSATVLRFAQTQFKLSSQYWKNAITVWNEFFQKHSSNYTQFSKAEAQKWKERFFALRPALIECLNLNLEIKDLLDDEEKLKIINERTNNITQLVTYISKAMAEMEKILAR
jgi:hypothetical protein